MGYADKANFNSIDDMLHSVDRMVRRTVMSEMQEVTARDLGLDIRAGFSLFVSKDYIAVEGDGSSLDYYGGFEYVDEGSVTKTGGFKFYHVSDDRVRECINCFYFDDEEDEDEAAMDDFNYPGNRNHY
jgi:hypothetical protein